jgi:hypothetical protein
MGSLDAHASVARPAPGEAALSCRVVRIAHASAEAADRCTSRHDLARDQEAADRAGPADLKFV